MGNREWEMQIDATSGCEFSKFDNRFTTISVFVENKSKSSSSPSDFHLLLAAKWLFTIKLMQFSAQI